jgi:hypothetical protein
MGLKGGRMGLKGGRYGLKYVDFKDGDGIQER